MTDEADQRPVVVLIGAPGAGKTRTGRRVARMLDVPFIDTDKAIVSEHGPVAEIFAEHGEAHFRALERAAVRQALRQHAVVALGGGAVLDPDTQAELAGLSVVQLTSTPAAIAARIAAEPDEAAKRPLLAGGGVEAWIRLVEARRPVYDRLSSVVIDTSYRKMEDVASEVTAWLSRP